MCVRRFGYLERSVFRYNHVMNYSSSLPPSFCILLITALFGYFSALDYQSKHVRIDHISSRPFSNTHHLSHMRVHTISHIS